ncbi:MAG: YjjG family noncanonical pyrimidine nucleotidase [Bacteroidetes bacterium]|nr:YjjG family noncanonical pyrimidine nucleotidase [Bacteroidales bacterium]MBU1010234.1 YjjG family noncanonical pyrimidine nucleotidase [Bacteroidota bacterium]
MTRKSYKHIFFDLDRTLWDFDSSARQTFEDIYTRYMLDQRGIATLDLFVDVFNGHNDHLWDLYRNGEIAKELLRGLRFERTLATFGIDDPGLVQKMSDDYIYCSPRNVRLFPHAKEVLAYLGKKYFIHLITNGFEEVQWVKLETSGLGPYFISVTTSEEAGVKKPDPGIFAYALGKASAQASDSIMVGDDLEVDIEGARQVGIDQVFFNPNGRVHNNNVTYEISSLDALMRLF